MNPACIDITNRRPVWEALSTLFLDTQVADWRQWRVNLLSASPYSLDTLDQILSDEVYPICWTNLYAVAGVWDGFDNDWLEGQILHYLERRWSLCRVLKSGQRFANQDPEWLATKRALIAARQQQR